MVNDKELLRRSARRTRDAIPAPYAAAAAEDAAGHLLALPPVQAARTVALYAPVRGEIDPAPAIRVLASRGVRLAYPRVHTPDRWLDFHEVALEAGHARGLRAGAFGILEPLADAPIVPLDAIDLFVVPGLAFDETGARLGWGHGFYDRTLARAGAAARVGYCYACQIVPHVPHGRGDLPMHYLVSEIGASRTGDRAVTT